MFETKDYSELDFEMFPAIKSIYTPESGRKLVTFHLEEASAYIADASGMNVTPIEN